MIDFHFSLATFVMAMVGLLLHFLFSWGEFYRAKDTAKIKPLEYITLDLPAWLAALVGTVAFYFTGPEAAAWFGYKVEAYTPGVALLVGYAGSSLAAKILGMLVSRASIR